MVLRKDAVLTLLKAIDGTMKAAELELTSPKKPGEDEGDIIFEGDLGSVVLKYADNILSVVCGQNGAEPKTVSQVLFEYEAEDWNPKDTKSVANEVCESVATFFGTTLVYDTSDTGKSKGDKQKNGKATEELAPAKAKKNKKESVVTYEPINLAYRLENIYTEIKGTLDENMDKYDIFLSEEYFATFITPRVTASIRTEDRPILKKLFNAFNIFYEEGENDVQSLVAVSILGTSFAKEPELFEKSESYMDEPLRDAVKPIMDYLSTPLGKRKLAKFDNPTPYKPSKFKKKK